NYTSHSFNYDVGQILSYLIYWTICVFIISIFALILDDRKYKNWVILTIIYFLFSVITAVATSDDSSSILSFDGKDLTLILLSFYSFVSTIYFIFSFIKNRNTNK
ncbi:MAG: hypothetical protein ABL917_03660, partial [Parcubacteria group bacterium]